MAHQNGGHVLNTGVLADLVSPVLGLAALLKGAAANVTHMRDAARHFFAQTVAPRLVSFSSHLRRSSNGRGGHPQSIARRPIRVLVVVDDADDHLLIRELLAEIEDALFDVKRVGHQAAVRALGRNQHDVCLLDSHLRGHAGSQLLREARALGCRVPVIVLAEQDERAMDLEAMQAGAADYLNKGVLDAVLLERSIRYAIASHQKLEALRRSERHHRCLAELSPHAICLVDLDATILTCNRQVAFFLGYDRTDRLPGQNAFAFLVPEERPRAMAAAASALITGGAGSAAYRLLKRDGSCFRAAMSLSLVLDTDGRPQGFVCSIERDVNDAVTWPRRNHRNGRSTDPG